MNYMLLVYMDDQVRFELGDTAPKGCDGLAERLMETGQFISGGILQPTTCATSVRLREGKCLVTDGPFAETREQLAGYLMVEANNLDEAIDIASQHPVAQIGTVEIRPLKEIPAVPPHLATKA